MINNIKKIQIILILSLIALFGLSTTSFASIKSKKSEVINKDDIDYDSFEISIYEKDEVQCTICEQKGRRGINLATGDAEYEMKIYFENAPMRSESWYKNKIIFPKGAAIHAELFDSSTRCAFVNNFTVRNLYESDDEISHVLVDSHCDYRLEIITNREGIFQSLMVVKFRNQEGIYSYLNLLKLATKSKEA